MQMKIKAIIWMFYKSLPRPIQETILSFLEFSRLITALPIFSLIFPFPCRNRIEDISKFDRRVFSQNGEDGIIEMLFRKIGTTNKYLVEFGAQDREYNGRFLVQIRGWCGLIMDCEKRKDSKIKKEKITAENVNAIFKKYEVPENFWDTQMVLVFLLLSNNCGQETGLFKRFTFSISPKAGDGFMASFGTSKSQFCYSKN